MGLKETHGQVNTRDGWHHPHIFVTLFMVFAFKFVTCLVSITLPIPCGMYMPMFACGGILGRFIGEFIHIFDESVVPGGYALVGAAAMAGGLTRTISSAVIVFEVTGELRHILPVLLAVLIANAVANLFALSIYDSIANLEGLPSLNGLRRVSSFKLRARDVMDTSVKALPKHATAAELDAWLKSSSNKEVAVIESLEHPTLVGTIEQQLIEEFMYQFSTHGSSGGEVSIPELDLR